MERKLCSGTVWFASRECRNALADFFLDGAAAPPEISVLDLERRPAVCFPAVKDALFTRRDAIKPAPSGKRCGKS